MQNPASDGSICPFINQKDPEIPEKSRIQKIDDASRIIKWLAINKGGTMFKFVFIVLLAATFVGNAWGGTLKTETELRPLADSIMSSVVKGGIPAAFATMKPYTILPEAEFQSAALGSQSQREQFGARYGKTVGYEFIGQKKLGDSLVKLTYIEKTEKHALPWLFYFYKTPSGWSLNSFVWNDQITQLFFTEK